MAASPISRPSSRSSRPRKACGPISPPRCARARPSLPKGGLKSRKTASSSVRLFPPGKADLSCLQYAAGGGSAIPVAVGSAIQDKFKLPVFEVYGMTETASVHTIAYADRPIRLGSVGLPVPYSRVRIVKLDADANHATVVQYGVLSMPTLIVFSHGEPRLRLVGSRPRRRLMAELDAVVPSPAGSASG